MTHVLEALSLLVVSTPALADEAAIRRMMKEKLHAGGEVESVQKAPFGDVIDERAAGSRIGARGQIIGWRGVAPFAGSTSQSGIWGQHVPKRAER